MEPETPSTDVIPVKLPPDFESIVDMLEYLQQNSATSVSISIEKFGSVSSLFISADARINHVKKLLKAQPGDENGRQRFNRGWQFHADKMVLLTKVTTDGDVTYKISISVPAEEATDDETSTPSRYIGSVTYNSDFELLSGEEYLPHALAAFDITKKKKLLRLLKLMLNDDDSLVILPMKRTDSHVTIKVAAEGGDIILAKKTSSICSLKAYLGFVFLVPAMCIMVEDSPATETFWIRSLMQTETRCFPPLQLSEDEEDVKVLMSCGYTNSWPHVSGLLSYHNGRLTLYLQPKKRSRSIYKFLGIVHEIDTRYPSQRGILDECIKHYLTETELLRSRSIKHNKVDEVWKRCAACFKWAQVTHPLEEGEQACCSNFNLLTSCEDAVGELLPKVGSNKLPPTPATARKRRRSIVDRGTPSVRSVPEVSVLDDNFDQFDVDDADTSSLPKSPSKKSKADSHEDTLEESDELCADITEEKPKSPVKSKVSSGEKSPVKSNVSRSEERSPVKSKVSISEEKSPVKSKVSRSEERSPVKSKESKGGDKSPVKSNVSRSEEKSPVKSKVSKGEDKSPVKSKVSKNEEKSKSPTKSKSVKSKSPRKNLHQSPSPAPSRGSSVFDFNSGSDAERVPDSLSEEDTTQATALESASKCSTNLDMTGDTTMLSMEICQNGDGDGRPIPLRTEEYYSLSDDEDPKAMEVKQLKSELSRCQKRLEMLRSASTKFLDLLLMDKRINNEPVVRLDASPEEVISILMSLVEDTENLKTKVKRK